MNLNWRHFVVAETTTDQFSACGQLKPHREGSLELASLAVEEAYRGQGVARAIIERLLAAERAPRPLYLMCAPELEPLYTRFGFRAAEVNALPPYFRRIHRLARVFGVLSGHDQMPLIMLLD